MKLLAIDGKQATGRLNAEDIDELIRRKLPEPEHMLYGEPLMRMGFVQSHDCCILKAYEESGGYQVLRRVVEMDADDLIKLVDETGILGRGGAMFPLGRKWSFTQDARPVAKHIVVNTDEREPGTFKDRYLMERDPFAVIEAATVAAYAIGAENGWIFIRGE